MVSPTYKLTFVDKQKIGELELEIEKLKKIIRKQTNADIELD